MGEPFTSFLDAPVREILVIPECTYPIPGFASDQSLPPLDFSTLPRGDAIDEVARVTVFKGACVSAHRVMTSLTPSHVAELVAAVLPWMPHASILPDLFALSTTRPLFSFLGAITVFERALYTLHTLSPLRATNSDSNGIILKDLLLTPEIVSALPDNSLPYLHVLFAPHLLNLRNLAWHGFVHEQEMFAEYASFVLLMCVSLPAPIVDLSTAEFLPEFDMDTLNSEIAPAFDALTRSLTTEVVLSALQSTPFYEFREEALTFALEQYQLNNELLFLIAALPVLEHGLRRWFCQVNNQEELLLARVDRYYSTLDGYGQRDKHQILLDTVVNATGDVNLLRKALGTGLTGVLADLFMIEDGPGFRAKICHGRTDLASLASPTRSCNRATRLVYACLYTLGLQYGANSENASTHQSVVLSKDASHAYAVVEFFNRYTPRFHPIRLLQIDLQACLTSLNAFDSECQNRCLVVTERDADFGSTLEKGECLVRVDVVGQPDPLIVVEKLARVVLEPGSNPKELPHICSVLEVKLAQVINKLGEAIKANSERESRVLAFFEISSRECASAQDEWFPYTVDTVAYQAISCLRALTIEITALACTLIDRVRDLEQAVASRTARTAQRRRYIATLQALKSFKLLLLATALVVEYHQCLQPVNPILAIKWLAFVGALRGDEMSGQRKGYEQTLSSISQFLETKAVRQADLQ